MSASNAFIVRRLRTWKSDPCCSQEHLCRWVSALASHLPPWFRSFSATSR
jgi:hypothetical protein